MPQHILATSRENLIVAQNKELQRVLTLVGGNAYQNYNQNKSLEHHTERVFAIDTCRGISEAWEQKSLKTKADKEEAREGKDGGDKHHHKARFGTEEAQR